MFGVGGSRFMEDLMRTDPVIVEGIAKSGALNSLLGSVYSPFRGPGMASPIVASYSSSSPWLTPDHKGNSFRFPISPTMEEGMIRRSARLTPSSLLTPSSVWTDDDDTRGSKRRRGESGNSSPFRKSLKMDSEKLGGDMEDFEAFAMGPPLPMTPFSAGSPGPAAKAVKTKLVTSEPRKKPSTSKRGEYKCGKCGFYPKKTKHDCVKEKAKMQKAKELEKKNKKLGKFHAAAQDNYL